LMRSLRNLVAAPASDSEMRFGLDGAVFSERVCFESDRRDKKEPAFVAE
jgi:hypothetical protein